MPFDVFLNVSTTAVVVISDLASLGEITRYQAHASTEKLLSTSYVL